jgi:hypothetical protein
MDERKEPQCATEGRDYDVKRLDLAQYFAPFGRLPMPDKAIWLLSLASSCLPENSMGAEIWLSRVAGVTVHDAALREWSRGLASALGEVKPKLGARHRLMFASYSDAWGHVAADDGMALVVIGRCPTARERARQLGCDRETFKRLRGLVAGFAMMQADQYEDALAWAVRACRMGDIDLDSLTSASPKKS